MNFLITGGAGFIGSHLSEALLKLGHAVCIIDDLSTGSAKNLENFRTHPQFTSYFDRVENQNLMRELIDNADYIYHLAAAVGVERIIEDPIDCIERNVSGTEIVLKLAQVKKKPVLITSTSEAYGKSTQKTFSEDDDHILGCAKNLRWSYACSKILDEFLALSYYHKFRSPVSIVRLFNTVGPRQSAQYGMVLPRFVQQALSQKPLTVYGDGQQTRCFTHVADVIAGLLSVMEKKEAIGEIINLGSQNEISIYALAQLVKAKTASKSEIKLIPYEKAFASNFEDMQRRVPNLEKAGRILNYHPRFNLEQIVDDVISFIKTDLEKSQKNVKKSA